MDDVKHSFALFGDSGMKQQPLRFYILETFNERVGGTK